jgi:hypothetical protein
VALSETNRQTRTRAWQTQLVTGLIARRTNEVLSQLDASDFILPLAELYGKVAAAVAAGSRR